MRIARDECYTTHNEAIKMVNYILENGIVTHNQIIWLPFDNEFSNIYKALISRDYNVVMTNLENGQDFYIYEPERWDIIITNPPFSGRTKLMNRLMFFDKPFIILQGVQLFNNQSFTSILCGYSDDFKFIMPQSRMGFLRYDEESNIITNESKGTSFYSFWLCYKTSLKHTFNQLKDSGKEREIERYDEQGNVIEDNHLNIFNWSKS